MKKMKHHVSTLALVAGAVLALSACQSKTDTAPGTATTPTPAPTPVRQPSMARVIHAIPGGAAADVFADDNKLFSGIGYKTITPYESINEAQVTFKLKIAAQPNDPIAENKETLSSGDYYTVLALPGDRGEGGMLRVLTDNKKAAGEGMARVRVVNAVADVPELDLGFKTAKEPVVSGLNAANDVGYTDVMASTGVLEARDKGKKRVVASLAKAELMAGKSYTIVIVGKATGTPKAEILVIEDGMDAAPQGMPAEAMPVSTPTPKS
ncbi:MAG: DUF4397 domain-containing protein [Vicinamibacteria bacterium]